MEVKVHPADPQKVLVRTNPDEEWVACDNIFGEFNEYLSLAEVAANGAEGFYLVLLDRS